VTDAWLLIALMREVWAAVSDGRFYLSSMANRLRECCVY
jgi:hypothetical protein